MNTHKLLKPFIILLFSIFVTETCYSQILFKANQTYSIDIYAATVGAGDVNNDGLEDMVYAIGSAFGSPSQYKIFVCTQTTAGTLSNTAVYPYQPVYPGIKCMKICDVNSDGLKDVIIGYSDSIGIFFQNVSGTLNPVKSYFSGTDVDAISCGDLNNDGLTDIAVCHWNASFIRVFYQNGSGFTNNTYPKPNGGYDEIDIGDMNSDNLNDVVFVSAQNSKVHIFTQNASGLLNNYVSYLPTTTLGTFHDFAIGDLNNDGANDLVISRGGNSPNAGLLIWFQNASGTMGTQLALTAYDIPEAIDITDFNCDGKPEIYTANGGWNAISIYSQDAAGVYGSCQLKFITAASHYNSSAMGIGDLDNDGRKDIVSISNTNKLNILYNVSKPTSFATIDTLIIIDTVYTNSQLFSYFFTKNHTDTLNNKYIVKIDSFKVTLTNSSDSVRIDTFLYRSGQICGRAYEDTILNTHTYVHYYYARDTILWASNVDTLYVGLQKTNMLSSAIQLYPNPTLDKVYLKFDQTLRRPADLVVEVFDHHGRRVKSLQLKESYESIDLSDCVEETYFVNILYYGKRFVYKVVKVK
jgi:hypothetical protein